MLKDFTDWLAALIKAAFVAAWDFIKDALIAFFGLVVDAFVAIVTAIPVPDFLSSGLSSVWSTMDPGVIYVVSQCGVPVALGIIGAGYAFRLVRKFATLFQW